MIEAIIAGLLMSDLAEIVGFPLSTVSLRFGYCRWSSASGAPRASWTHGPEGRLVNAPPPKPKEQSMKKMQGFEFAVILILHYG